MPLSNKNLKILRSLGLKKFRQKYNKFTVEGDKMVRELLAQNLVKVEAVFGTEAWLHIHRHLLKLPPDKIFEVTPAELKKVSNLVQPNAVLALCNKPEVPSEVPPAPHFYSLFLDDIRDPGNFGTILRSADWFGISSVYCSPGCVDSYNPKVIQATMGAYARVRCFYAELKQLSEAFPEKAIYGTSLAGKSIYTEELDHRGGWFVIGNESKGISADNRALVRENITIPGGTGGKAESLNAAIAAGIILSELNRRESVS